MRIFKNIVKQKSIIIFSGLVFSILLVLLCDQDKQQVVGSEQPCAEKDNNSSKYSVDIGRCTHKVDQKKIAVFDFSDFITEDTTQIIRKIGMGKMASYALTHWRSPVDSCLDALGAMGADEEHKSAITCIYKDRQMPNCIVAWQQGECPHHEAKHKVLQYIDKIERSGFFASKKEKEITQSIIEIVFDPTQVGTISKPIPIMIKIAQELKQDGYTLYAVANMAQEVHTHIASKYPEVIGLFDGVVASHQIHALKNNKKLFEHLVASYNLDPAHCLFIDKGGATVQVAQDAGLKTMQFTHQKQLRSLLKKQGVF